MALSAHSLLPIARISKFIDSIMNEIQNRKYSFLPLEKGLKPLRKFNISGIKVFVKNSTICSSSSFSIFSSNLHIFLEVDYPSGPIRVEMRLWKKNSIVLKISKSMSCFVKNATRTAYSYV